MLKLCRLMAAILVGRWGNLIQFWKGTIQEPFRLYLVPIGKAVSEEKIFKHFPHRVLCYKYVGWWRPSWFAGGVIRYNSERGPPKDHSNKVWSQLAKPFQRRRFLNIFPIGSYVKTMLADGGHLGWRAGSSDTILKGDHLRIIPIKFGPN